MRDKNTGKVDLQGFRVAILVTDGFEQVELEDPREALQEADAETSWLLQKDRNCSGDEPR